MANRSSWEGWSVNLHCHKDELLCIHQDGNKRRLREEQHHCAFVCVEFVSLQVTPECKFMKACFCVCVCVGGGESNKWKENATCFFFFRLKIEIIACTSFPGESSLNVIPGCSSACVHQQRPPCCIFRRPHIFNTFPT